MTEGAPKISAVEWDRLIGSVPVDRQTGIVVAKAPEPSEFRFAKQDDPFQQDGPHRLRKDKPIAPSFVDLTGKRFGRFVVLGIVDQPEVNNKGRGAKKGTLWAVRCDCSRYTARRHKTLVKEGPWEFMCNECDYAERVKNRRNLPAEARAFWPDEEVGK